jgi:ketosteroid isomerase-like protein
MRLTGLLLATLLFARPSGVQAHEAQANPEEQVLIDLEEGWNEALYRRDVAFIERILAEEFTATYVDGSRGDKAKELAMVAAFNQRVDSSTHDDMTVRVYGDTAVVWFTLRLTGPKDGHPTVVVFRYVDVFVKRDGRWQCVSSQSTRATP